MDGLIFAREQAMLKNTRIILIVFLILLNFFNSSCSLGAQNSPSDEQFTRLCYENKTTARSKSCIQWLSMKAVQSFSLEPLCRQYLSVPLMMCIFKKEIGSFDNYYKNGDNLQMYCSQSGCGLSQMTQLGVWSIKNALKNSSAIHASYQDYWEAVGQPNESHSYENMQRQSALNPYYAAIMTAIHLCADAHSLQNNGSAITTRSLALLYNAHPNYKYNYATEVTQCTQNNSWVKEEPLQTLKTENQTTTHEKTKKQDLKKIDKDEKVVKLNPEDANPNDQDEYTFYNVPNMGILKLKKSQIKRTKDKTYIYLDDPEYGLIRVEAPNS